MAKSKVLRRIFSCGCKIVDCQEIKDCSPTYPEIEYCPLHKSAPDMYEALKLYIKHQQGTSGHYCWQCAEAINEATAKAEGN